MLVVARVRPQEVPQSQPASLHHVPTHRLPLRACQPSLTRETLEQKMETGKGSVPGRGRGQCQAGEQCSTHRGAVPALLAGLPSVTPRATFTLQWGQAQGHRTDRDLPITSQGSADMQRALDKVKEGASRNFLSLSVKKGKVLCLEWTGTGWGLTG